MRLTLTAEISFIDKNDIERSIFVPDDEDQTHSYEEYELTIEISDEKLRAQQDPNLFIANSALDQIKDIVQKINEWYPLQNLNRQLKDNGFEVNSPAGSQSLQLTFLLKSDNGNCNAQSLRKICQQIP